MNEIVDIVCRLEHPEWCSLVTVIAGEEGQERAFILHRDKLIENSHFFKTALNGRWQKSQVEPVTLSTGNHIDKDLGARIVTK